MNGGNAPLAAIPNGSVLDAALGTIAPAPAPGEPLGLVIGLVMGENAYPNGSSKACWGEKLYCGTKADAYPNGSAMP
jgi:hypothetical protein